MPVGIGARGWSGGRARATAKDRPAADSLRVKTSVRRYDLLEASQSLRILHHVCSRDSQRNQVITMFERWRSRQSTATAKACVPDGWCLYVVGDIHGEAALLRQLLASIEHHVSQQRGVAAALAYVGDYIDRGPASAEVLDIVCVKPGWAAKVISLRGNHEEMLQRFLIDPAFGNDWRHYGGLETLASFGVDVRQVQLGRDLSQARDELLERIPQRHRQFLNNLGSSAAMGDYFLCHAGVRPGVRLADQRDEDLLWIREPFLTSTADFGKIIIHGHSPVEQPEMTPNRINVDTGAYLTGRLTCAVLQGSAVEFLSTTRQ